MQEFTDQIILGDCLEVMRSLPDKCVDLVVTDPPFFKVIKAKWDNQWKTVEEFASWCGRVGDELRRVMKDSASLYWFGDDKSIAYVQIELDRRFHLLNSLIWDKTNISSMQRPDTMRSFLPMTERILFYEQKASNGAATSLERIHSRPDCFKSIKAYLRSERDKMKEAKGFTAKQYHAYMRELTGATTYTHYFQDSEFELPSRAQYENLQKSGFFQRPYETEGGQGLKNEYEGLVNEYKGLREKYEALRRPFNFDWGAREILRFSRKLDGRIHETQKPVKLIQYLIEKSSRTGELVLDPFSGSGTTAVAAHNARRHYLCIEADPKNHAASVQRVREETAQKLLEIEIWLH